MRRSLIYALLVVVLAVLLLLVFASGRNLGGSDVRGVEAISVGSAPPSASGNEAEPVERKKLK